MKQNREEGIVGFNFHFFRFGKVLGILMAIASVAGLCYLLVPMS
jgi:hypothetical protein